jgi:hypothetical protein
MATNPQYIVSPPLQEVFRDKITGEPLRNGVLYFWKDQARSEAKPVFKQSGVPGNYTYVALPNPLTLSSAGTPQDPNTSDDINIYYKPYDDDGNIEFYFIEVYSEGGKTSGVFQFTRQGWPPDLSAEQTTAQDLTNYVPNGQFLAHNDIPEATGFEAGEIREPVTVIAQGGWTFERPVGSAATDIVTFVEIGSTENPTGNPRFAVNVNCEVPSGDTYKDLRLKFDDVNKFASSTDNYTFAFSAESNTGSSITVQLVLIKNFGSGGSTTTETPIQNLTISGAYAISNASFNFGTNENETIGEDSYIQLAVRFPTSAGFDVQLTDFVLTPGTVTVSNFPPTTDEQFKRDAIFGSVDLPAYDGSTLYLKPVYTAYGMTWDDSVIGDVVMETQTSLYDLSTGLHPSTNRLLAIGKQYETADYSPLGIPYARLQSKYWIESLQTPRYGTGANYLTCGFAGTGNQLIISNNSAGSVTDAANGATSTTFTIATIHQGDSGYNCKAYLTAASTFYIDNTNAGAVTAIAAETSGFTVGTVQIGNTVIPNISSVQTIAAAGITAGDYFTFRTYNGGEVGYYCWFKIDGAGADPAVPGLSGIEVDLLSTDDAATVAQKIRTSLNGWEVTTIQTVAGSAVPAGSWFTMSSTSENYFVWYTVDGAGTKPTVANHTEIKVEILSTDTNTQVASKTQRAVNQKYFATPDLRDQFLRGLSNGATLDPGVRWSMVPGVVGDDTLGTFELSGNLSHQHEIRVGSAAAGVSATVFEPGAGLGGGSSEFAGSSESRPINANVNLAIIY